MQFGEKGLVTKEELIERGWNEKIQSAIVPPGLFVWIRMNTHYILTGRWGTLHGDIMHPMQCQSLAGLAELVNELEIETPSPDDPLPESEPDAQFYQ